jgi:hypothetical protein
VTKEENTYKHIFAETDTPCLVKIGGELEKFVPNINISKWNDECWLNINHPDVVGTEVESEEKGIISLRVGDNTHRYYVAEDGTLEYEIVLHQKPVSNRIRLNISFPDGLVFFYQAPLTQKEKDDGASRPINVVGSYAVYWNRRDNQYKTGKFCHIYRPRAVDVSEKAVWCDQNIFFEDWTIEIPQSFLDSAEYPVVIDPNLGYSTQGGSQWKQSAETGCACHDTTDGSGGDTAQLHMWVSSTGAAAAIKMCIYSDDSGNDRPEDQQLTEVAIAVADGFDGQKDVNYVVTLAASTKYWVAFVQQTTQAEPYYDSADANRHCFQSIGAYDLPANWGDSGSNNTTRWSMWADYTSAAAGDEVGRLIDGGLISTGKRLIA